VNIADPTGILTSFDEVNAAAGKVREGNLKRAHFSESVTARGEIHDTRRFIVGRDGSKTTRVRWASETAFLPLWGLNAKDRNASDWVMRGLPPVLMTPVSIVVWL